MASSPGGGRFPSRGKGDIGGGQGPPFASSSRRRQPNDEVKEVIDLSASSPEPSTAALFAGAKLSDFTIGDRLGATRDGGEGFQGCNSRVFRATLRRQGQPNYSRSDDTATGEGNPSQADRPVSMTPPPPPGVTSGLAAMGGHYHGTPARQRRRSLVGDMMDLGEQVWKGSFGACFSGNHGGALEGDGESREGPGSVNPRDGRADTEWALKMALTYAGQDPLQAAREMETEIAILVGGRISPHDNVMRGVHSFQDEIGKDLQPVLWDGLGPEAGQTLSSRTFFVVMPLFTAGSLQALLNKRQQRCKGPPFLRLLETMRFVEQMLSAVTHLLAHGIAHNDIKPDNWLLRADQRTLVLTDFGAAVDALRPSRQMCSSSSSSSPAAPVPQLGAAAATNATGPGAATFASLSLTSGHCQSTGAASSDAAADAAAAGDCHGAVGGATGEARKSGDADKETFPAPTTARFQPVRIAKRVLSVSERLGLTGTTSTGMEGDEDVSTASPSRKRRRHYGDDEIGGGGAHQQGGDMPEVSSTTLSDKLLLPFSKYCEAGTPSIVAPELARAWREEKDLDFRRSDVFSVGVCMYRMLRPDSVYIDNGTGLEGKGPLEKIEGRFGQHAWPLPLFPENKGGCPYEVAQLCRGLLQPDPVQRQGASEGQSVVSWFVSRLESAERDKRDRRDATGSAAAASDPTVSSRSGSIDMGPPMAGGGAGDARMHAGSASGAEDTCGASAGKRGREGSAIVPVDMTAPPLPLGAPREFVECGRDMMLSEDEGQSKRGGGVCPERSSPCLDKTARRAPSEEERRLEEPDELVRSDRISHMRDFFASAAPDDLFQALDSKAWDVAAACAVFDDGKSGEGGGVAGGKPTVDLERRRVPRQSEERASTQGQGRGPFKLWFEGVPEELKGRRREAFATPRRQQPFLGKHNSQMPSSRFGT